MPKLRVAFVTLLIVVWELLAWHRATAATTPKKAVPANSSPAPHLSDADLEKAIRARLAASKISTDKFTAHVRGGIATLEGYTEVVQHKGTATRLAKSAGALAVVNNIQISQAAKDKAQANLDSGRRRAQVKRSETSVARTQ
jgi:BON domain